MTELRFDGRVAVITGAGRGLGRAYALLLASRGATVVVNDLGTSIKGESPDSGPAEAVAQEIRAAGGQALANTDTVATAEGGAALIQAAMDHYGRIDILVHNAGNVRGALLTEMTHEDFNAVLDVHLKGGFNVLKPAFGHMVQAAYGRIVMTSSIGGLYGIPTQANYGAAKAGLIGLSNVAAHEGAGSNVKCNAIVPGAMTRMAEGLDTSFYTAMTPEMVAPAVAWLCHESCTVTGEAIVSIAGRVARARVAESPGVYQPAWTIEGIAGAIDAIRNIDTPYLCESQMEHIQYSCEMAANGGRPPR